MVPHVPVDYTGTGAAVTLASILGVNKCKWFQVNAVSVGGTAVRLGDKNVSATQGFQVGSTQTQFAPPIAFVADLYDLTAWYILVQSGDTVTVGCAN